MSHYTIHQDDDDSKPVHTYHWSLLKDGKPVADIFTQSDAETIRAALNGEQMRVLIEDWREAAAQECRDRDPGWVGAESARLACADDLEASIAQQDTSQPTAEQER